jgi:two-component system response regulator LytT
MKKRVYIVEDISIIRLMLEECMIENGFDVCGSSPEAENALIEIGKLKPDLVLLDIKLVGKKNGVWLGNKLNQEQHIPFIYITANQDERMSIEILETNPVGFIVKPINTIQLILTVKIALNLNTLSQRKQVIIQDGLKAINLTIEDIFYIQSEGNYLNIYLETTHFLIRSTLDAFLSKLNQESFVRIHQRYAINIHKEFKLSGENIYIKDSILKISEKYKSEIKLKLK